MALKWSKFAKEIFFIQKENDSIVYAPLLGKFFSVEAEDTLLVEEYLNNPQSKNEFYQYLLENNFFEEKELPKGRYGEIYSPRELCISLTSGCNLACSYCYARAGEDNRKLSWEKIEVAIKQLYQYALFSERKDVEITFHGTGEATVEWKTLVRTVEYAIRELPEELELYFSLVTNGVLLDEEKVSYLADNDFSITLSVDGLEKVQNLQRPFRNGKGTFEYVVRAIDLLVKKDVRFGIRTTITGYNQDEMIDFVKFCSGLGCKTVDLVPYSEAGRGESGILSVNPESFVKNYEKLLSLEEELNISVHTISDNLTRIGAGFCDGDGNIFALMPDGQVSSCTRVTRADDILADRFFIGQVSEGSVDIDLQKIENLQELNVYNFPECEDCFAKYICSGGCHADRLMGLLSKESCYITREVLWINLLRLV